MNTMENFEFQFVRTERIKDKSDGKDKIQCNLCKTRIIYKEGAYTKHFSGKGHIAKFTKALVDVAAAVDAGKKANVEPPAVEV